MYHPYEYGQGRIRTYVALSAADLQSAAINHSATCPGTWASYSIRFDEVPFPGLRACAQELLPNCYRV